MANSISDICSANIFDGHKDKRYKYKIGVIDFLTDYGAMKKAETTLNNIIHWKEKNEVSC